MIEHRLRRLPGLGEHGRFVQRSNDAVSNDRVTRHHHVTDVARGRGVDDSRRPVSSWNESWTRNVEEDEIRRFAPANEADVVESECRRTVSVTAITAFSVTVSGRSGETTVVSWTTRSGDTVFERGSTCREKNTPVAVVRSPRGTDLAVIFLAAVL